MSIIKVVYEAIIANIDDADELRGLAQLLDAEAERRGATSIKKLSPDAAWPFPTSHVKNEKENKDQSNAKSPSKVAWPFP